MSKVLTATCANGKVTVEGKEIEAEILSSGVKSSSGVVVLDGEKALYIASSAGDVKDLIISLADIVQKQIAILTAIDAASNAPGGQTAAIAELTTLKTQLSAMKDNLK